MLVRMLSVAALLALSGCSFYARGPDDYKRAVRNLLDTKSDSVEACYKNEIKSDEEAKGKVVVKFDVEPKTGNLVKPEIVAGETTANKQLQGCVLSSLEGLKLAPPDQRKGEATFAWEFSR